MSEHVLVTGATGLIGGAVVQRLLRMERHLHVTVLVRDMNRWRALQQRAALPDTRVTPVVADVAVSGLGLPSATRAALADRTTHVVHAAADTTFSQPLARGRRTNRDGTLHVLELAAQAMHLSSFMHVSTAFVAGCRTGVIAEDAAAADAWVNAYEQSKYEAEQAVRASALPWRIARPSTVVCDGLDGRISQVNAVHRALELYRSGLAAMVPGTAASLVDVVTTDYVAAAIARLTLHDGATARTYQLCAGERALPLGELLDRCYAFWSADERWRRRGIERPALADLATYRLFEQSVEEVGDVRLRTITRSLTHFAPQLALPKQFDTHNADATLGFAALDARLFWTPLLRSMRAQRAARRRRRAA